MTIDLPLGPMDPISRIFAMKQISKRAKHSPEVFMNTALMSLAGYLSLAMQKKAFRSNTDRATLALSNLPGISEKLTMKRVVVEDLKWVIPLFNYLGLAIQVMSYDGQLRITLSHDKNLIAKGDQISTYTRQEFQSLKSIALLLQ